MLLDELTKIITREKDSEAVYRSLVAVGTLVTALGDEVRTAAREIYEVERVLNKVLDAGFGREPRIKTVVSEIRNVLR
jgi:phospholipase A-2-activating protein